MSSILLAILLKKSAIYSVPYCTAESLPSKLSMRDCNCAALSASIAVTAEPIRAFSSISVA